MSTAAKCKMKKALPERAKALFFNVQYESSVCDVLVTVLVFA